MLNTTDNMTSLGSEKSLVIGTRGSALALWQTNAVRDALLQQYPQLKVDIKVIKTVGDANLSTPLEKIDDKGLFTKELEAALIAGEIDACVHSMKDVPGDLAQGCAITAMLPRADVRDVLICGPRIAGCTSLAELPAGTRIATGSLRRAAQLRAQYPQIVPTPIRGNVDTRVRKALGPDYEGAILAAAGVMRLGLAEHISAYLDPQEMIPAVGQGAIGIETRDKGAACELVRTIDDPITSACVNAERIVLQELNGGCKVPMGAYARRAVNDGADAEAHAEPEPAHVLLFDAFVSSVDANQIARIHLIQPYIEQNVEEDLTNMAYTALKGLYEQGAREIRDEIARDEPGERQEQQEEPGR